GMTPCCATIERNGAIQRTNCVLETVAHFCDAQPLRVPLFRSCNLRSGSETDAQWSRQRSGPQSILLSSPVNERLDSLLQIASQIEGSNPFWTVKLVRGKRERPDRMLR